MSIIEDMKWRHACKAMTGGVVEQDKVDRIIEAINLTPTSLGLQAYKILVIENKELREKIFNEACQQQPIVGCSHLIVFASRTEIAKKDLDYYFEMLLNQLNHSKEWVDNFREKIEAYLGASKTGQDLWLKNQTYIALGIACAAAASERVDSVPIEGFSKTKLDKILNLESKGLTSTVLLPLGICDVENDWWGKEVKVRKNLIDFVEIIK